MRSVADFINHEEGSWDEEELRRILSPIDKILLIPLARSQQQDVRRWFYIETGIYSVKFGYHIVTNNQDLADDAPTTSNPYTYRGKLTWRLKVIPKVQFFIWRIFTNSLLTKSALLKLKISVDPICQRCGEDAETIEHVLRECAWIQFFGKFLQSA